MADILPDITPNPGSGIYCEQVGLIVDQADYVFLEETTAVYLVLECQYDTN
jgi:hypothetical protein